MSGVPEPSRVLRKRLLWAFEDGLVFSIKWAVPVLLAGWFVLDWWGIRQRANASFEYLNARATAIEKLIAPRATPTPAPVEEKK